MGESGFDASIRGFGTELACPFELVVVAVSWQSNQQFLLPAWIYAVHEISNARLETTS